VARITLTLHFPTLYEKKPTSPSRLALCTSLLLGTQTYGYAQEPKAKDKKPKVAKELQELVNRPATTARVAQVGGLQKANLLQVKGKYVVIEAVSTDADGGVLLRQLQELGLKKARLSGGWSRVCFQSRK
jgi:hypothetical protein